MQAWIFTLLSYDLPERKNPAPDRTAVNANSMVIAGRMTARQRIVAIPQRLMSVPGINIPSTARASMIIEMTVPLFNPS